MNTMSRMFTIHDEMLMVAKLKQEAILAEALKSQERLTELSAEKARRQFFLMFRIRSFLFRLAPRVAARHML